MKSDYKKLRLIKNEARIIAAKHNGKRGGRPRQGSEIRMELPDIEKVVITPAQYGLLLDKYGYELLNRALFILDDWLKSGSKIAEKYVGKNNYAHFRADSWLMNAAREK